MAVRSPRGAPLRTRGQTGRGRGGSQRHRPAYQALSILIPTYPPEVAFRPPPLHRLLRSSQTPRLSFPLPADPAPGLCTRCAPLCLSKTTSYPPCVSCLRQKGHAPQDASRDAPPTPYIALSSYGSGTPGTPSAHSSALTEHLLRATHRAPTVCGHVAKHREWAESRTASVPRELTSQRREQ